MIYMKISKMHFLQPIFIFFITFLIILSTSKANSGRIRDDNKATVARTITVDQSGQGDFVSVQKAIDSVQPNNNAWTLIHIKAGIYKEKVTVPQEKPFIALEGDDSATTVIQLGDAGDVSKSSTFSLSAENFVAKHLTFKNTYNIMLNNPEDQPKVTWAPAALINSDKSSFHQCAFISLQDTLTDSTGRHYFDSCYIEGAIDFIWGSGQSIYQDCTINVTASLLDGHGDAYITAQGRNRSDESNGFVFKGGAITGTGPALLGRAYRQYSTVLFYQTKMDNIIDPLGWSPWEYSSTVDLITFAEVGCTGPGSDLSKRVSWLKKLPQSDLDRLTNVATFINADGWLEGQP